MRKSDYEFRKKLAGCTLKDLQRLYRRMWNHIEKWYGTGSWDWPTLHVVYPQLSVQMRMVLHEIHTKVQQ